MTERDLVEAIEARYVALCRGRVRVDSSDPDRIAYEALRTAIEEHATDLRRFPEVASVYQVDIEALRGGAEQSSRE